MKRDVFRQNAVFFNGMELYIFNTDHPLHLLQKRALRIVVNQDYIAHSEPICKSLGLLRVTNMFKFALWKFYFRLMNNKLPTCFEYLKPVLPRICDIHNNY